jgi:hypothetical protein
LSELNHHLPKEQVKIVEIDGKTAEQNEMLMKKSAELTKEIEVCLYIFIHYLKYRPKKKYGWLSFSSAEF